MKNIRLIGYYDIVKDTIVVNINDRGCIGKISMPISEVPDLTIEDDGRCEIEIERFRP